MQMQHKIVSRSEWLAARKALLAKEKEQTRLRDQLAEERRALPWVKVEKNYVFDTPRGKRTLADAARQSRWESRDNQDENAPLPG